MVTEANRDGLLELILPGIEEIKDLGNWSRVDGHQDRFAMFRLNGWVTRPVQNVENETYQGFVYGPAIHNLTSIGSERTISATYRVGEVLSSEVTKQVTKGIIPMLRNSDLGKLVGRIAGLAVPHADLLKEVASIVFGSLGS